MLGTGGAVALAWALHNVSKDAQLSWQLLTLKSALGIVLVVIAGGRQARRRSPSPGTAREEICAGPERARPVPSHRRA